MIWFDSLRLCSSSARARWRAVQNLTVSSDRRALPLLVGSLGDEEPGVRCAAAKALGSLGDQRSLIALLVALDDPEATVRAAAAHALAQSEDHRKLPALLKAARDPEPAVRAAALYSLGQEPSETVTATLLNSLHERDAQARLVEAIEPVGRQAIVILRNLTPPAADAGSAAPSCPRPTTPMRN